MKLKQAGFTALITVTIAVILLFLNHYNISTVPPLVLVFSRWLAIAGLVLFGLKKKSLTAWILIAMVVGAEIGHDYPDVAMKLQVLSKVFLKMIKTIVGPLLFATLVYGIAGHADLKQVGRMGWKSILYFEVVTTIALFIGLAAINISQAGAGIKIPPAQHEALPDVPPQSTNDIILHIFPENIAKSVADGQILQIVVFSIIFGIGLAMVREDKRLPMLHFAESLAEVMFKFTNIVMYFAPIGVGAAIAYTVGHMGLGILVNLFQLLATLYVALLVFLFGVLLPIALIVGVPIKKFIAAIAGPVSIAFATTSSEAALPRAMENLEKLGVPRKIVAFVMPTGYSFNLDGTTLYLALASIFVAQAAGMNLSLGHQLLIVFTLMLTSKGVAGVPRASLVILLGTASSFGMPTWPIFIILGIDELMDMARTSVNVIGNCLATVVVAKWEKEFHPSEAEQSFD
ncbi:proton glutamate symport protein [Arcticibacter tournemirensis]|uniref:Cation:dicarboxylase symporter family transporter n=1 Tax=Arcticibacter tournemirensis TaxID=699437 RepID=A0A5M9HAA6_9SPHI|nr:cation:dicarboxylase symporter family transporter [Arcticibacter tournemirensis]KAA8483580.1 cation:dicarboxylase symporter family transporter [Arcticibacter tournemirensis]TQM51468.1 proton glutamate symport protein [Arcticibacter tournemirensis]